jgi:hypothetical protein
VGLGAGVRGYVFSGLLLCYSFFLCIASCYGTGRKGALYLYVHGLSVVFGGSIGLTPLIVGGGNHSIGMELVRVEARGHLRSNEGP